MTKAEINRRKIIDYLSDPENKFLERRELSLIVLGYKNARSIYCTLSPSDLDEIETEAFEIRKQRCSRQLSQVYTKLYNEAVKGNVPAAKEFLDRVEGKVTHKIQHSGRVDLTGFQVKLIKPDGQEEAV